MNPNSVRYLLACLLFLAVFPNRVKGQDHSNRILIPAGTLLPCTLNEPNLSSKTAEIDDPVVCSLGPLTMFGRALFPRGAYLAGHLEAAKDPGRFFGKGNLVLKFDRLGFPEGQAPAPTKIIVASGYKVDRQGKIIGHGHATRDAVEWMFPPLWPVKVLTLPKRGPRPALKGEEHLTLRLMADATLLAYATAESRSFERSSFEDPPHQGTPASEIASMADPQLNAAAPPLSASAKTDKPSVLTLRNGTMYVAQSLRVTGDNLAYTLADGSAGTVTLQQVDWKKTFQDNAERGAVLTLTMTGSATAP